LGNPATRPDPTCLIEFANRASIAGIDMIQVRERDLPAGDVFRITEKIAKSVEPRGTLVLVNDRSDIAASLGCGVHLTTQSLSAGSVRQAFGSQMLIGISTHNIREAQEAEQQNADFIVFGPVFETESKKQYGSPVGIDPLQRTARAVAIPVLALGGINLFNFRETLDAGAAGVAGITMFTQAEDLRELVAAIKGIS
jgi:thiamine-phosphate pyrophosphorylase